VQPPPTLRAPTVPPLLLLAFAVWGVLATLALLLVPLRFLPAEDAMILYSYSRNLAHTGVISFFAGGPRAEGATDFGFMLLLAGAMRCGLPPFPFCAAINAAALPTLAAVLLAIARVTIRPLPLFAVAGAAALSRQVFAAASGFAVLPDACLLALLVLCSLRDWPWRAASTALALCLLRPDGVLFAVPLLLRASRRSGPLAPVLGFVLPGCAYFLWRWHYFGELFPLPFLVKETFHRDFLIFIGYSMRESLSWLFFAAAVLVPTLGGRVGQSLPWLLTLLVLPTLFYWTVRMDQNVAGRFFFFIPLAVALLLAIHWAQPDFPRQRAQVLLLAAWAVLLALPYYREWLTFRSMQFTTAKAIALSLQQLPQHGTLMVTEAGFVPFFSEWPTVDAWGLNTPEFAHRFVQPADVRRLAPDLLVVHPDLGDHCIRMPGWRASYPDREFQHMVKNLTLGAEGGYQLWLTPYGSAYYQQRKGWRPGEGDRECWFVRTSSPLKASLEGVLAAHGAVPPVQAVALEAHR
jgi:hypothetical protein